MDFQDLMKFSTMPGQNALDSKLVEAMLDVEKNLETKNLLAPDERNMLILLLLCDREFGTTFAEPFGCDFLRHQLSLGGFNRASLERMAHAAPEPVKPATA